LSTDELDQALSTIPAKGALWDGTTGIRMENASFLGIVFYQRVSSLTIVCVVLFDLHIFRIHWSIL
jgi:hypothetical protein